MNNEVFFCKNGNIVVSKEGVIINSLNSSFVVQFLESLEKKGEFPETFLLIMPDGRKAKPFRTRLGGWSWSIE